MANSYSYHEAFAHHYDFLREGDDYERWTQLLASLIQRFGSGGLNLLDVGCGTGTSSFALADRGFMVTGCDISPRMLCIAHRKNHDHRVTFLQGDMRRLPNLIASDFDVVTWMDDVANNFLTSDQLVAAFKESYRVLRPGGLLLFDVNTVSCYTTTFSESEVFESPDLYIVWRGRSGGFKPSGWGRVDLTAFSYLKDRWAREDAQIIQRHYPSAEIEELAESVGFAHLASFGLHDADIVQPSDEYIHRKIIHVARKGHRAFPGPG